jgi:subtilisin-like proprotein convertase family protein
MVDDESSEHSAVLSEGPAGIYGGAQVTSTDPVARSTVGLFSKSDYQTGHALIDGSGTLLAPSVIVGAAHTCLNFKPAYVYFGTTPPDEDLSKSYTKYIGTSTYPGTRRITRCVAHPNYDSSASQGDPATLAPNDIALFFVDSVPSGFVPARVIDPAQVSVPTDVTIAGFGAYENQWDNAATTGMLPYQLRKVESFLTQAYAASKQLMDGPNPGKGSCQGDSGGSVYARTNQTDVPVLLGIPVSGPECDQGIGYDTDVRYFIPWIEATANVMLTKVRFDSTCGNGKLDGAEVCDGGSIACTAVDSVRYSSGTATCNSSCNGYDTAACVLRPLSNFCESAPCVASGPVAIPDNNPVGVTVPIAVASFAGKVETVEVKVNITHTYRGELVVSLSSPSGTTVVLHNKAGGSADNLNLTVTPTAFAGQNPVGTWVLKVSDNGSGDLGKLDNWSLKLTSAVVPVCGDGVRQGSEACDKDVRSCASLDPGKYESGSAACNATCTGFVLSACVERPVTSSCVSSPCQNAVAMNIPDNKTTGVTSTIRVATFSGALVNANVKVRITHPYRGDLHVLLTAPNGATNVLHNKTGGSADNLDLDVNLGAFGSASPVGDWKLQVSDRSSSDTGRLDNWSLQLR